MHDLLNAFEKGFLKARDMLTEFVFRPRTVYLSEKIINSLIDADRDFVRRLEEKGLSGVKVRIGVDRLIVSGVLTKKVKGTGLNLELSPEQIVWTKDEQAVFMKVTCYSLENIDNSCLGMIKVAIIRMTAALFSPETLLRNMGIEMRGRLIKIDMKNTSRNSKIILQSIELTEISCLEDKLALTIRPRPGIAGENLALVRDWLIKSGA